MRMKSLCLVAFGALAIGCGNAQDSAQNIVQESQIIAKWSLRSLNDSGTQINVNAGERSAFIEFEAQGFNGNAGCNNFFGSYQLRGNQINIDGSGMTRMMCSPESMAIEDSLTKILAGGTSSIQIEGNTLVLQKDSLKATFAR